MYMSDNELLLAISSMMDEKLEPLQKDISNLQNEMGGMKAEMSGIKAEISDMKAEISDTKIQMKKISDRMKRLEINQENEILPRLRTIEACYTSTYERYAKGADQIQNTMQDMSLIKKVVTEHSAKLKRIQ